MNIIIFGPNGSGKGTQGAIAKDKFGIPHIETGVIFRENIKGGTELGTKAKEYIDKGDLVPDDITIPMILNRLQEGDAEKGWLLDGFPRNKAQAEAMVAAMKERNMPLNFVIEIQLPRDIAKLRITGRRLCANDNNHPNHIAFDAIKPVEKDGELVCRVCGGALSARADDQDDAAIDKRHDIYYDEETGTMAAVNVFKAIGGETKVIEVNGEPSIQEVTDAMLAGLK